MTISDADTTKLAIEVIFALVGILLVIVGFLLRRVLVAIDTKLEELVGLSVHHESRLVRLETHLGFNVPERPERPRGRRPSHD